MGPAIAQGAEIALSGHDRADAAGDGPVLTPGVGAGGAGRGHGDTPTEGVVRRQKSQISAVQGRWGRAPGARILGSGPFTGEKILYVGP